MMPSRSFGVVLALATLFATGATGCYARAEPVVYVDAYQPTYYEGYVVYYDGVGRPYYYYDGESRWVPRTYVHYDLLVGHYHRYRPAYHRWYRHEGHRYRTYRRH
jgi:hypothetical protein